MDGDDDRGRSAPGGDRPAESAASGPGPAARILGTRVPLWSMLVVVLVAAVAMGLVLAGRSSVDLGGAVDGAKQARVSLTICNEIVDARKINPRQAELDFESGLRDLGASDVDVVVERVDCGSGATGVTPAGG